VGVAPQPGGRRGLAVDFFVARRRRCPGIASFSLLDLASQAPSANITLFMGGSTKAHKLVQVESLLPYLSHAPMEPMNCEAHVRADGCDVGVGTQGQTQALKQTAQITGLDSEQIQIHTTYLGGGFGRRVKTDFLEEAVELSKASGKPVKVIWKGEEDIQYDAYRTGNSHRITGALNERGRLLAWSHKVAAPSIIATLAPQAPPVDGPAVTGITN